MNSFKYSLDNKRYHTFNYYLKTKYNAKVAKVILDAGFTCPNRDGTKGYGGCIYCSKSGSGEFGGDIHKSLTEQFYDMIKIVNKKNIPCKYIGYFQARTNTYAPVKVLKEKYEEKLIWIELGLQTIHRDTAIYIRRGYELSRFEEAVSNLNNIGIKPIFILRNKSYFFAHKN